MHRPHFFPMLPVLVASALALAPLEPESGFLFGHWYDINAGDSPKAIQDRTQSKLFSIWQIDFDIDSNIHIGGRTETTDIIERAAKQLDDIKSDAVLYMTVYPKLGFGNVTDQALQDWIKKVKAVTDSGRGVMIRYASEMNGNWFPYAQRPIAFQKGWKTVVDAFRKAIPDYKTKLAFIWGPNSANGYPWHDLPTNQAKVLAYAGSKAEYDAMDYNKDGKVDVNDDPYSPYYPGDDYVDWVGISIYHYGLDYPWITNDVPLAGKFEGILTGAPMPGNFYGKFNFYDLFCAKRGKPFIVTETGATVHISDPQSRANIKQGWWRQFLNTTFIQKYPLFKGASTFEFIKYEETTWRDFTNAGKGTNNSSPLGNDGGDKDNLVLKAFQDDFNGQLGNTLVSWSKAFTPKPPAATTGSSGSLALGGVSLATALLVMALY
ncbi:glycoside hydrolase superfamily [Gorgonomyces haynaldii]|nr:glycoside hydrolase superfamily [Gorgonomyces haynaldii]